MDHETLMPPAPEPAAAKAARKAPRPSQAAGLSDEVPPPLDAPAAGSATSAGGPGDGVPVVRVVGPSAGRWRAGRKFGPEAVTIPLAELSDGDIAALQGDPMLLAVFGVVPADSAIAAPY